MTTGATISSTDEEAPARRRAALTWGELRAQIGQRMDRLSALRICELAGYRPLPWQIRFHLATGATQEELRHLPLDRMPQGYDHTLRMHKAAFCGLGSGKSHAFVWEMVMLALMNPGHAGIVIAPTFDLLDQELLPRWQQAMQDMAAAGFPLSRRYAKTNKVDHLHCGGRVVFRSAQKIEHLRGIEFGYGGIDESEISVHADRIWDVVTARVRARCGVPELVVVSTPRGMRANVARFHKNRELVANKLGRCALLKNWFQIRATSRDNPHLSPGWLAGLEATYSTRRWQEEVEAQILQPASQVWQAFTEAKHRAHYQYNPARPYDIAYDAGDQYPHILWIQTDTSGRDVVFLELCPDNIPPDHLHQKILEICKKLRRDPEMAVADRAVPREISWLRHVFPRTVVHKMHTRAEQSVNTGIQVVEDRLDPYNASPRLVFADGLWRQPPRRGIVNCMRNYRYIQTASGEVLPTPLKDNVHDHGADALRMHQVMRHATHSTAYSVARSHVG